MQQSAQQSAETLAITATTADRTSRVWLHLREDLDSLSVGLETQAPAKGGLVTKEVTASLTFGRQSRIF